MTADVERILTQALARQPQAICGYHAGAWTRSRTPLLLALAQARTGNQPQAWCFDRYDAERWRQAAADCAALDVLCQPEWPSGPFDLVVVELSSDSAAELACEVLQAAWDSLRIQGELWVAVDNPRDQWTRRQLATYADAIQTARLGQQVWYHVTKSQAAARHRNFQAEFAFRAHGELIWVITRPGVFSHRRLDNGARQLIRALPAGTRDAMLDLGCGSGAVALAAARANPGARVVALDSNVRALQVLEESMERNRLPGIERIENWDGNFGEDAAFDWVLANPPYFAQQRIAAQFIRTARRVLRPRGQLVLVTKAPREIAAWIGELFAEVEVCPGPNYTVVRGRGAR